jgi:Fic family protein
LLTDQVTPHNRTLREVHDIQNTEQAFFHILEKPLELSHESIISLHQNLMANIDPRIGYRTGDVHVVHSHFTSTPAPYVKTDMTLLLRWYHSKRKILHPLILAGLFHHKFEKIHPFFDGNGRTGRMLMNAILLTATYPPCIVRKTSRAAYLEALSKADGANLPDSPPATYKPLVNLLAVEYADTYWSNFL